MPSSTDIQSLATIATARTSTTLLSRYVVGGDGLHLRIDDGDEVLELPGEAVAMLRDILHAMANGERVRVVAEHSELTTVEAANLLNVSRPYLIGLLDTGKIPCRKVGTHRRIRLDDLLAYKAQDDRARQEILDQLIRDAVEQDMGYGRQ